MWYLVYPFSLFAYFNDSLQLVAISFLLLILLLKCVLGLGVWFSWLRFKRMTMEFPIMNGSTWEISGGIIR